VRQVVVFNFGVRKTLDAEGYLCGKIGADNQVSYLGLDQVGKVTGWLERDVFRALVGDVEL
jgi:hypothetical protein